MSSLPKRVKRGVVAPRPRSDLAGRVAWHYTTGRCMAAILNDRFIRPATAGVRSTERPAAWFSLSDDGEQTANKSLRASNGNVVSLDRPQTRAMDGGLYRIGVDAEKLVPWGSYVRHSGVGSRELQALVAIAVERGSNPERDWLVAFGPVPSGLWLAVHAEEGEMWIEQSAALMHDDDPTV